MGQSRKASQQADVYRICPEGTGRWHVFQGPAAAPPDAPGTRRSDQSCPAQSEDMQRQLAELKAKRTDRGMVLTLGDVLFDTGAATRP